MILGFQNSIVLWSLIFTSFIAPPARAGAFFLENVARALQRALAAVETLQCSNLVLLLTHFYNFGLVHCAFVYSLIDALCVSLTELDVELLLVLLKCTRPVGGCGCGGGGGEKGGGGGGDLCLKPSTLLFLRLGKF